MRPARSAGWRRHPMWHWRCLSRWRRCCGGCRRAARPSAGLPPNAAATRTPSTTAARPRRSPCRRRGRWPARRSRATAASTPAARPGAPWASTVTTSRRLCSAMACPATAAPPSGGSSRCSGRPGSRRCSRSGSCAAMTSRCARRDRCGCARTRCWSPPPPTSSAPVASRCCASAASRRRPDGGCLTCWRRAARSFDITAISTGAASGSPRRCGRGSAAAELAGTPGITTGTPMQPSRPRFHVPDSPGCPGSRSRHPGIRPWPPPWRGTAFASKRSSPWTLCWRT